MLENLDVNVADLRNFDKILFSNGHTEDVEVDEFKKFFIAWCFKLQTPTTYRDFVTLQRSVDRLYISVQEGFSQQNWLRLTRAALQKEELRDIKALSIKASAKHQASIKKLSSQCCVCFANVLLAHPMHL